MSIKTKRFQDAKSAVVFLEDLALGHTDTIVFRGHSKQEHRLSSTWHRENRIPTGSEMTNVDVALNRFKVGMEKLGLANHDHNDRSDSLEHGRHFGIPTPCIDFSYSPYVALFFAFNGVKRSWTAKKYTYSVVYALNVTKLAHFWVKQALQYYEGEDADDKRRDLYFSFLKPDDRIFDGPYPVNNLQFIPFPGKKNTRMQRQLGALLYDSIIYSYHKLKDLEELIERIDESQVVTQEISEPTLYKILINQNSVADIFARLELMNITGGNLYNSGEGVAMDIANTRTYNPKFSYLRDIQFPNSGNGNKR